MKRSLLVLFLLYSMLNATIINVPDDQPTIQEGIDASADGDTVLVQPGTYYENINYNGKNIAVASLFLTTQDTTYISITAIDGNQNGSVVTFNNNESYLASLCGFTITNGSGQIWGSYGYIYGGGIFCHSSSPILKNLIIKNNDILPYPGFGFGAGISIIYSNLIMENILITNNYSEYCGGGISIQGQNYNPICKNVIIANNTAVYGGGIYCYSSPSLENLSIMNNNAAHGGGIQIMYSASPTITNSIISNNSGGGVSASIIVPVLLQ